MIHICRKGESGYKISTPEKGIFNTALSDLKILDKYIRYVRMIKKLICAKGVGTIAPDGSHGSCHMSGITADRRRFGGKNVKIEMLLFGKQCNKPSNTISCRQKLSKKFFIFFVLTLDRSKNSGYNWFVERNVMDFI